jgi:hypothetical protein
MRMVGRWLFRTVAVWAAGKAWQTYQDKKARDRGYTPAK